MAKLTIKCVFDGNSNLVAVNRDAGAGETALDLEHDKIDPGVSIGNGYYDDGDGKVHRGSKPPTVAKPTVAEVTAHTAALIDLRNISWIWKTDGTLEENNRWQNWHYWIGSLHYICIDAIDDATVAPWAADWMLKAFKTLAPVDAGQLAIWYRQHTEAVWTAYRQDLGGQHVGKSWTYAGFMFPATADAALPAFASDAAAATQWGVDSATTRAVRIALDWRGP